MLDRERLEKIRPRIRTVELPDIGEVKVRSLLGTERDAFESWVKERGGFDFWAGLLARTLVNPDDSRMYADEEWEQVKKLPFAELEPAFKAALSINGLDEKSGEEIAKNSESDRSDDSTSGSQWLSEE